MLIDVEVPDLGTDGEVEIIEIPISEGDTVAVDDTLITLESDKASMDIPAPEAGIVKELLVKLGDKIKTGTIIAKLENSLDNSTEVNNIKTEKKSENKLVTKSESITEKKAEKIQDNQEQNIEKSDKDSHAGPASRRFAQTLGVDLTKVNGSGQKNRILKTDIQDFVKESLSGSNSNLNSSGNSSGLNVAAMPEIDFSKFGEVETKELSRIKKLSGSFLHRNWVNIPHVTQFDSADITELEAFRKGQKEFAAKQGVKLTPLVFIMKAVVSGLKTFPSFNSSLSFDNQSLILKKYCHIGVAVDTPNGLVVPVVRNVDKKSIFELAQDLAELSAKARDGKLTANDMQGGCFTISSLGGIGGTGFTPIVNAPEVAILGVSKSSMQAVYINGKFEPRLMLPLSLSYDHRVIDGAEAVRFTNHLVFQLADIRRLLL